MMRVNDSEYRENLSVLELQLTQSNILGVYETGVPLEFNAALHLGCVAVVAPSARKRNLGTGFELDELQARPVVQYEYFSQKSSLQHMLLHHSFDGNTGRGVYSLHLPHDGTCHIWVVNPAARGRREVTSGGAERAWEETAAAVRAELEAEQLGIDIPSMPKFEVAYARSEAQALKAVQRALSNIKDRARYV